MQYSVWRRARGAMVWTACALLLTPVLSSCELASSPGATAPLNDDSEQPSPVVELPRLELPTPGADAPVRGDSLGNFRFTMYYVAIEDDPPPTPQADAADDAMLAHAAPSGAPDTLSGSPDMVTVYHRDGCRPLAEISRAFVAKLDMQGTGKLRDGRVINTSGVCRCPRSPCYMPIKAAWAVGANGRLSPFRSVAIDTKLIKLGSLLYVPELDGKRMPGKAPWGGFVHDGCVVADDRGGGIAGRELDLFVAKKVYSDGLYRRHRIKRVTVHDGAGWCERKGGKVRKVDGAS
jgi:3D (Asp-Asp-Asp) domain-containing protein